MVLASPKTAVLGEHPDEIAGADKAADAAARVGIG
jgi:hypothetical protein